MTGLEKECNVDKVSPFSIIQANWKVGRSKIIPTMCFCKNIENLSLLN